MFLGFEIVNNRTKFKNKFHYKMRFFIKNKLYKIFLLYSCLLFGLIQASPINGILLQSETKQTGQYYFYAFQENQLNLYEINQKSEFYKIWEYSFLSDKQINPTSLLYGDITGNGQKELIIIGYVFGKETEVYIFPTNDNIPTGAPSIYQISSLKKGARPISAQLIPWDEDKDKEISIAFSSPERKIVLLDYNINKLEPIKTAIATEFMTTTYGPINMEYITSKDKKELLLYTSTDQSKIYTYNLITKKENIIETKISTPIDINTIFYNGVETEIIINKKGKASLYNNKQIGVPDGTKTIIGFSNKQVVQIAIDGINILSKTENQDKLEVSNNKSYQAIKTNYLYNLKNNLILVYDPEITTPKLFIINEDNIIAKKITKINNLSENTLTPIQAKTKTPQDTIINSETISIIKDPLERPIIKEITTNTDTLYVNSQETLEIAITENDLNNIYGVETTLIPIGMSLNPNSLAFTWTPQDESVGEHAFEYIVEIETDPTLTINTTDKTKLTLERIAQKETQKKQHLIIVNDIPQLNIENKKDTINIAGNFTSSYTIKDLIKTQTHEITVKNPTNNTVLISDREIYWEPLSSDFGEKIFIFDIFDGLAHSTDSISIFVDTTKTIKEEKLIATLNEEFTYQLPGNKQYKYNLLSAPSNLRVSSIGLVHWVPLITHVDENIIDIEVDMGSEIKQYRLNVYVNAPPVISFRPNSKEYITKGDTFSFMLQNFDFNVSPQLSWKIQTGNPNSQNQFNLDKEGRLTCFTDSLLDNQDYIIILSDTMRESKFFGTIYVNSLPQIVSTPPNYLILGDTLIYNIDVVDLNKEKPFSGKYLSTSQSTINYKINEGPKGVTIDSTGRLFWIPQTTQLGSHNFEIEIADSLIVIPHTFTLFVNDKPNIISKDSLSIMVGDTLEHLFNATDLNGKSDLIYSIKTTIDELTFSGKAGKLTWIPTIENIGLHNLEISVSDGFSQSLDNQKLTIFVYVPPTLINVPDSTAYANLEYTYTPKAYDMYKDSIYNKDIFISFIQADSIVMGNYNNKTNTFSWTPSIEDLGVQRIAFEIVDKYNTTNSRFYDVSVLMSPCEILDTLYVDKTDTVYIKNKESSNSKFNMPFYKTPGISY